MIFTIFNKDGEISHTVDCDEITAKMQVQGGQVLVDGEWLAHFWDGFSVQEKPQQPTAAHEWIDFKWVLNDDKLKVQFKDSQAAAIASIGRKHAQMLDQLTGSVTEQERNTWQLKLPAAAASVAAGEPTDAAITLFYGEAQEDGVTVMVKCQRSMQKSEAYTLVIGMASRIKTRAENGVMAAENVEQIDIVLQQAITDAQEAAGQYLHMIGLAQ